jgi:hypothetical protein
MNSSTDLDDVERDLVRTLRAKGDQIIVEDVPFHPAAGTGAVVPLDSRPRRRGRLLAAAAMVAVLVAGAAAVQRASDRDDTVPLRSVSRTAQAPHKDGVAAFLPATLPPGWALKDVSVGRHEGLDYPDTRQLFADEGAASPRGVVVFSSGGAQQGIIFETTYTIHGQPANVGPSLDFLAPAGALNAFWNEGDIVHNATAVGVTEADLVAFLESLEPHDDPARGFAAPVGGAWAEIDSVTSGSVFSAGASYAGPEGEVVGVTTEAPDRFGGLLNRLAGERGAGGFVIRETGRGAPFVTVARDDGWSVQITSIEGDKAPPPALLDDLLASLRPISPEEFVDLGTAEPVTTTATVAGWRVDVHGTDSAPVAMCLTSAAGDSVCSLAVPFGDIDVTTGSFIVGGEWILVVMGNAIFEPTVADNDDGIREPRDPAYVPLDGEQTPAGDQVIQVFALPSDVDDVGVMVPIEEGDPVGGDGRMGTEMMGMDVSRPTG